MAFQSNTERVPFAIQKWHHFWLSFMVTTKLWIWCPCGLSSRNQLGFSPKLVEKCPSCSEIFPMNTIGSIREPSWPNHPRYHKTHTIDYDCIYIYIHIYLYTYIYIYSQIHINITFCCLNPAFCWLGPFQVEQHHFLGPNIVAWGILWGNQAIAPQFCLWNHHFCWDNPYFSLVKWMWVKMEDLGDHRC